MEGTTRDLAIAVIGALVGSLLVYLVSVGFQWTARSRAVNRKQRETDESDWKSGDPAKRQRVFNAHLFAVLKYFIIASLIVGVTTAISDLEPNLPGLNTIDYVDAGLDVIAVLFYAATLGKIMQFMKLMREHP